MEVDLPRGTRYPQSASSNKTKTGSANRKRHLGKNEVFAEISKTKKQKTQKIISEVQFFSPKNIKVGQVVLGSVCLVAKNEVKILMPHVGFTVKATCDGIHFMKDDFVLCKILTVAEDVSACKTTVALSETQGSYLIAGNVFCGMMLFGTVKEVIESKGFVIDTGIPGVHGFLASAECGDQLRSISLHSYLRLIVVKVDGDATQSTKVINFSLRFNGKKMKVNHPGLGDHVVCPGQIVTCTVDTITPKGVALVNMNAEDDDNQNDDDKASGVIHKCHQLRHTKEGTEGKACVLYTSELSNQHHLSFLPQYLNQTKVSPPKINIGESIGGLTVPENIPSHQQIIVLSSTNLKYGDVTFRLNLPKERELRTNILGKTIRVQITKFSETDQCYSVVHCKDTDNFALIINPSNVSIGQVVTCTVTAVIKGGLNVTLEPSAPNKKVTGFIPNSLLQSRTTSNYKRGNTLRCRITAFDARKAPILTTKRDLIPMQNTKVENGDDVEAKKFVLSKGDECKEGVQSLGVVTSVKANGLSINFFNHLRGFLPRRFLVDSKLKGGQIMNDAIATALAEALEKKYSVGDVIRVEVHQVGNNTEVDKRIKRKQDRTTISHSSIWLRLPDDVKPLSWSEIHDDMETEAIKDEQVDTLPNERPTKETHQGQLSRVGNALDELPKSMHDFFKVDKPSIGKETGRSEIKEEPRVAQDDDTQVESGKKKQRQREAKASLREEVRVFEEERKLAEIEAQGGVLKQDEVTEQTERELERRLRAEPNSSLLWAQLMSCQVARNGGELEAARATAHRALTTIDCHEEAERLNIWSAMLALEHQFGTPDSLQATLNKALQTNDPVQVYSKLLKVYTTMAERTDVHRMLTKKYSHSIELWSAYFEHLFFGSQDRTIVDTVDQAELCQKARKEFKRALQVFHDEPKTQCQLMLKFASLELKHGDAERGKTLYQQILASRPSRYDIWHTLVDALIKDQMYDDARAAFERLFSGDKRPPLKKSQAFLSKWVQMEEMLMAQPQVDVSKAKSRVKRVKDIAEEMIVASEQK